MNVTFRNIFLTESLNVAVNGVMQLSQFWYIFIRKPYCIQLKQVTPCQTVSLTVIARVVKGVRNKHLIYRIFPLTSITLTSLYFAWTLQYQEILFILWVNVWPIMSWLSCGGLLQIQKSYIHSSFDGPFSVSA